MPPIQVSSFLPGFSVVLATVALIIGTHGIISCHTLNFPSSVEGGGTIETGLFSYETYGVVAYSSDTLWIVDYCRPYTDIEDDMGFNYVSDDDYLQRIAITIPILGGIAAIGSCIFLCVPLSPLIWKFYGLLYLVTCILQGVSLKVQNSSFCTNNPIMQFLEATSPTVRLTYSDECEWGAGFRESISATVFWGIAAIICLVLPAPQLEDDDLPVGLPASERQVVPEQQEAPLEKEKEIE